MAQHLLNVDDPQIFPRRRLDRLPTDEDRSRQRRGKILSADVSERLGDGRLRGQDDGFRGHQTTGGVVVVGQQGAHILGVVRFHECEEPFCLLIAELAEEVGRVIGFHLLQHRHRTFGVEGGEELDLCLIGQLLDDVGQAFVVEGAGDLESTFGLHLEQDVGEVGGFRVLVRGNELRGLLIDV